MPTSLRKACHACVSAKRKCNPQLPACERCVKRGIECVYDLEPVAQLAPKPVPQDGFSKTANSADTSQFRIVYDSVSNARDASASAMAAGMGSDSSAAHPLLVADGETALWLMKWFTQVARDGLDCKASPFVHSRIVSGYRETLPGTEKTAFERDVLPILTEIHHLIRAVLQRLLLDKPSIRREALTERAVEHLYSITQALWSKADTIDLQHLKPCEAWRVAESIRRSMFAAIFVRGIWSVTGSGYCHYEPFLESLPFDSRAGLWEAETEEAWSATMNLIHHGEHTRLKSWREFTEASEQLSIDEDGQLQRMLYVSFHGSNGIKWLEELDKRIYAKVP